MAPRIDDRRDSIRAGVLPNITAGDAVSGSVRSMISAFTLGQIAGNTLHMFCGATVTYSRIV